MTVLNVAHRKHEPNSFVHLRENGFGPETYLFVHFIKPANVTLNGIDHFVDGGACIIYSPEQRMEYRHHNGEFLNDFIIFKTDDSNFISRFGLPENVIFYVFNDIEISNIIESITYTITDKTTDRSSETPEFVNKLFETASKLCIDNYTNLKRTHEMKKRFIALRDEILTDPKGWTVAKMAKHAWLTGSWFAAIYADFFGVSPGADLIEMKIAHAKKLLNNTALPIAQISELCGYTNVGHFIRTFRKLVNSTPLQYRKKCKAKQ